MRRICRVDNNQQLVVRALREIGCSVEHLHVIGRGVPDCLWDAKVQTFCLS